MNVLDLFSGIGGFSLGLERAGPFRTVAFCEREPFPQAVLRKHWPEVPIYDDVRTIPTERLGRIDLICGGFPCQPWSVAGQQRGAEDDRDLWPVMASLIEKLRPRWVVGENVRGFVNEPLGLQRSLSDLESLGYQTAPFVIPACAVDAPHRRDRVWIVAHSDSQGEPDKPLDGGEGSRQLGFGDVADSSQQSARREEQGQYRKGRRGDAATTGEIVADTDVERGQVRHAQSTEQDRQEQAGDALPRCSAMANADDERLQGRQETRDASSKRTRGDEHTQRCGNDQGPTWLPEPNVGRVAHGVPRRVDRLKALGNAVVPQVVEQIGRAILDAS